MYFSKLEHESDPCRVYYIQITEFHPQKFWFSLSGDGPSSIFPTRPGDADAGACGLRNTFWEPCSIFTYNIANPQTVLMYIVFLNIIKPGLIHSKRGHLYLNVLSKWFSRLAPCNIRYVSWKRQAKPWWQFYKEWNRADSRQFLPSRKGVSHSISSLELWSKEPGEQLYYEFTYFFHVIHRETMLKMSIRQENAKSGRD